jgi:hypothetical protein
LFAVQLGWVLAQLTEGLTEAGQQLIERYQAGLDISSDEAIEEYLSSAAAGAVLGGGIGGLGGALSKSSAKIKQEQLERDLIASENDFKARVEKANKPTYNCQRQKQHYRCQLQQG